MCVCVCVRERERENKSLCCFFKCWGGLFFLLESGLLCLSKRSICEFFMHLLAYMRLLATRRSDVQSVCVSLTKMGLRLRVLV
jgi:hypothetical protein